MASRAAPDKLTGQNPAILVDQRQRDSLAEPTASEDDLDDGYVSSPAFRPVLQVSFLDDLGLPDRSRSVGDPGLDRRAHGLGRVRCLSLLCEHQPSTRLALVGDEAPKSGGRFKPNVL